MAPEVERFVGLPLIVVTPVDVGRLVRELETIDNALLQQELQKQEAKLPKTTRFMDELIDLNKLNLLDKAERLRLKQFLAVVKQRAPLLHVSFGADPSSIFVEKVVDWLRENIHPLTLMTIGLQPTIGAGCLIRTTNKYFDFSLSKHLGENRELLMKALRESIATTATTPPQPATQTAEVAA
jgi:hypothetical protein